MLTQTSYHPDHATICGPSPFSCCPNTTPGGRPRNQAMPPTLTGLWLCIWAGHLGSGVQIDNPMHPYYTHCYVSIVVPMVPGPLKEGLCSGALVYHL